MHLMAATNDLEEGKRGGGIKGGGGPCFRREAVLPRGGKGGGLRRSVPMAQGGWSRKGNKG